MKGKSIFRASFLFFLGGGHEEGTWWPRERPLSCSFSCFWEKLGHFLFGGSLSCFLEMGDNGKMMIRPWWIMAPLVNWQNLAPMPTLDKDWNSRREREQNRRNSQKYRQKIRNPKINPSKVWFRDSGCSPDWNGRFVHLLNDFGFKGYSISLFNLEGKGNCAAGLHGNQSPDFVEAATFLLLIDFAIHAFYLLLLPNNRPKKRYIWKSYRLYRVTIFR